MSSELGSLPLEARSTPSQEVRIPPKGPARTSYGGLKFWNANADTGSIGVKKDRASSRDEGDLADGAEHAAAERRSSRNGADMVRGKAIATPYTPFPHSIRASRHLLNAPTRGVASPTPSPPPAVAPPTPPKIQPSKTVAKTRSKKKTASPRKKTQTDIPSTGKTKRKARVMIKEKVGKFAHLRPVAEKEMMPVISHFPTPEKTVQKPEPTSSPAFTPSAACATAEAGPSNPPNPPSVARPTCPRQKTIPLLTSVCKPKAKAKSKQKDKAGILSTQRPEKGSARGQKGKANYVDQGEDLAGPEDEEWGASGLWKPRAAGAALLSAEAEDNERYESGATVQAAAGGKKREDDRLDRAGRGEMEGYWQTENVIKEERFTLPLRSGRERPASHVQCLYVETAKKITGKVVQLRDLSYLAGKNTRGTPEERDAGNTNSPGHSTLPQSSNRQPLTPLRVTHSPLASAVKGHSLSTPHTRYEQPDEAQPLFVPSPSDVEEATEDFKNGDTICHPTTCRSRAQRVPHVVESPSPAYQIPPSIQLPPGSQAPQEWSSSPEDNGGLRALNLSGMLRKPSKLFERWTSPERGFEDGDPIREYQPHIPGQRNHRWSKCVTFANDPAMSQRSSPLRWKKVTKYKSLRKSGPPPPLAARNVREYRGENQRGRVKESSKRTGRVSKAKGSHYGRSRQPNESPDNHEEDEEVQPVNKLPLPRRAPSLMSRIPVFKTVHGEQRASDRNIGQTFSAHDDLLAYLCRPHEGILQFKKGIPPEPYHDIDLNASPRRLPPHEAQLEDNEVACNSPFEVTPALETRWEANGRNRVHVNPFQSVHARSFGFDLSHKQSKDQICPARSVSDDSGSESETEGSDAYNEEGEQELVSGEPVLDKQGSPTRLLERGGMRPGEVVWPDPGMFYSEVSLPEGRWNDGFRPITEALRLDVEGGDQVEWDETPVERAADERYRAVAETQTGRRREEEVAVDVGVGRLKMSRSESTAERIDRYVGNLAQTVLTRSHKKVQPRTKNMIPLAKPPRKSQSTRQVYVDIASKLTTFGFAPISTIGFTEHKEKFLAAPVEASRGHRQIDRRLINLAMRSQQRNALETLSRTKQNRLMRRYKPIPVRGLPVIQEFSLEESVETCPPSQELRFGLPLDEPENRVHVAPRIPQLRFTTSKPPPPPNTLATKSDADERRRMWYGGEKVTGMTTENTRSETMSIQQLETSSQPPPHVPIAAGSAEQLPALRQLPLTPPVLCPLAGSKSVPLAVTRAMSNQRCGVSEFSGIQEMVDLEEVVAQEALNRDDLEKLLAVPGGANDEVCGGIEAVGGCDDVGGVELALELEYDPVQGDDLAQPWLQHRSVCEQLQMARAEQQASEEGKKPMTGIDLTDRFLQTMQSTLNLFGKDSGMGAAEGKEMGTRKSDGTSRSSESGRMSREEKIREMRKRLKDKRARQGNGKNTVIGVRSEGDGMNQGVLTFCLLDPAKKQEEVADANMGQREEEMVDRGVEVISPTQEEQESTSQAIRRKLTVGFIGSQVPRFVHRLRGDGTVLGVSTAPIPSSQRPSSDRLPSQDCPVTSRNQPARRRTAPTQHVSTPLFQASQLLHSTQITCTELNTSSPATVSQIEVSGSGTHLAERRKTATVTRPLAAIGARLQPAARTLSEKYRREIDRGLTARTTEPSGFFDV